MMTTLVKFDFRKQEKKQIELILVSKVGEFWFGLVWFYGISAILGYLMPNPFYTY